MINGWRFLKNSGTTHYFKNGYSVCDNWLILSSKNLTAEPAPDEKVCTACAESLQVITIDWVKVSNTINRLHYLEMTETTNNHEGN